MEGLLKFNDLEEHFSNSLIIIDRQNEIIRGKQDLEVIVSKLTEEISVLKNAEQKLTQQFKSFSSNEDHHDISAIYTKLKEKYVDIQEQCNGLEKEKLELEEKQQLEKDKITEDFLRQIEVLEKKNQKQKEDFSKIQCDFNNKLAAQQASADIRYDEMESHLRSQIRDITQNLHDSMQSCNTLRQELFSFKTYSSADMDSAKKRIQELEMELRLYKKQQLNEEQHFNYSRSKNPNMYSNSNYGQPQPSLNDTNRSSTNIVKNKIVVYNENPQHSTAKPHYICNTSKYPSLNARTTVEQEESSSEEYPPLFCDNSLRNIQSNTATLSCSKTKHKNVNSTIPPLKQLTVTQPRPKTNVKKRKLYNPNNVDYLIDMEPPE